MENCLALIIRVVRPLIDYIGSTQSYVRSFLVGFGQVGSLNQKNGPIIKGNILRSKSGSRAFARLILSLFWWINHSPGFPLAWVFTRLRISISIGIFTQTRSSALCSADGSSAWNVVAPLRFVSVPSQELFKEEAFHCQHHAPPILLAAHCKFNDHFQ